MEILTISHHPNSGMFGEYVPDLYKDTRQERLKRPGCKGSVVVKVTQEQLEKTFNSGIENQAVQLELWYKMKKNLI